MVVQKKVAVARMLEKVKRIASYVPPPILAAICGTAIVLLILGALNYFNLRHSFHDLLAWLEGLDNGAGLIFTAIMAAVIILLLPGVLFTVGAGFVFGVVKGTAFVVIGTTLGAVCAFLISRYLFGERMSRFFLSHVSLRAASNSMVNDGLRIVFFTRLIPLFPFKLSNYFFGLTPVRFKDFTLGTLVGIIPFSLHNAYLGSMAADIVSLGEREAERTPLEWTAYGIGLVMVIVAVSSLARIAQKALKTRAADPKAEENI